MEQEIVSIVGTCAVAAAAVLPQYWWMRLTRAGHPQPLREAVRRTADQVSRWTVGGAFVLVAVYAALQTPDRLGWKWTIVVGVIPACAWAIGIIRGWRRRRRSRLQADGGRPARHAEAAPTPGVVTPGDAERSWAHLPRQHRRRKPRGRTEQAKRSALGEFRPLAGRPAKAASRAEPGHWEGDLIIAKANRTAVATLVERASRHTLVVRLPGGYSAPATARAVSAALARQPSHMVKTLTWDQGREMARWADIEKNLGITVYFCEPRSPWQQPANEQTNGLLRRWLPKSTDLDIGPVRLAIIEDHLNTMPRRIHNWNSAQTAYTALSCNHR